MISKTANDIAVDRGQPVIVTVTFGEGDPDAGVFFSYMKPGSQKPHVDDGYGEAQSKIERIGDGVYRFTISTKGFKAGKGFWHFRGEWKATTKNRPYLEASIFGEYSVNDAPTQLL